MTSQRAALATPVPGHKSRAMIDRYSREDRKDRQIAASKLGL